MRNRLAPMLATVLLAVAASGLASATAVVADPQATADEQRRFLDVRRRQIDLAAARAAFKRAEDLSAQGLLSRADLDAARAALDTAQLTYQEAVLTLLNLQPRLSVREAVKYQAADGRKFVRLRVENLTPTFDDSQFQLLNNFEGAAPIPEALRTRQIRDIFISLKDPGVRGTAGEAPVRGTTIALPYEVHVAELGYGQSRTLEFQLLRDVNSVVVASSYKGQAQEIDIELQQAATATAVMIVASQGSQEADLGSQAHSNSGSSGRRWTSDSSS